MSSKKDLLGFRFCRLVVIESAGTDKNGRAVWLCRCDCGNYHRTLGKYLLSGETTSCGCRRSEILKETTQKQTTHGKTNTRIYTIWQAIKNRCNNPNNKGYNNYGGRNIKMCIEWENSFEAFYKWAIDNGYNDNLSIDRINTNAGYYPENCRWADGQTQANNTRRNHYLTYKGKTKTMAQWATIKNIKYSTLRARINTYKWTIEKALETP